MVLSEHFLLEVKRCWILRLCAWCPWQAACTAVLIAGTGRAVYEDWLAFAYCVGNGWGSWGIVINIGGDVQKPTLFLHGGPAMSAALERLFYGNCLPVRWWEQPRPAPASAHPFRDLLTAREVVVREQSEQADGPVSLQAFSFAIGLLLSSARTYFKDIYQKAGQHSQAELVRLLIGRHLILSISDRGKR